jgi:tRNA nucleotidyltransferase/poly(A) polymerase
VDVNITLSEQEQKIFKTLMEVVEEHQLKTTLRVAGGWVRDKVSS